jgi:nickel-type superoxide dismutase maturation protease
VDTRQLKDDERRLVVVHGDSMWPTLRDGQQVYVVAASQLKVKDVVLAVHPLRSSIVVIKRISEVRSDGRLALFGDNPDPLASEDSHNFGPVDSSSIVGKIQLSSEE